jgi:hypothetical protein
MDAGMRDTSAGPVHANACLDLIVPPPLLLQSTIWYTIHTPLPAARFTLAVSQTSMCLVAQVLNVVWFYKCVQGTETKI